MKQKVFASTIDTNVAYTEHTSKYQHILHISISTELTTFIGNCPPNKTSELENSLKYRYTDRSPMIKI